ncbi:hypothetical protein MHJ94_11480 [Chryseobacterium taklimakanense]|uniref:hypothetical protein n=1 Tax=Chryseobacterium taklimakanense TaxID=536441 RepID=UPI001EF4F142|nr:hypothetical protein [Chryseobacterium taklimakanense]MCG7281911.1 hypothetical protein [Chryseobacterium taklimakanense]
MNTIEREARRMNIFRKIMAIESEISLERIENLLEEEEKKAAGQAGGTQHSAISPEDTDRAITGEELLKRIKPRLGNLFHK